MRRKVIHRGCGELLFWTKQEPGPGVIVQARYATLPDGSKPISGTPIMCPVHGRVEMHAFMIVRQEGDPAAGSGVGSKP